MLKLLSELKDDNIISQGDYYFAKLIADKQAQENYAESIQNLAILLAALCSWRYTKGNTCSYLDSRFEKNLFDLEYRSTEKDYLANIREKIDHLPIAQWQSTLRGHIAFTQDPINHIAPMAFQFGALYFYRTWQDEYRVAQYIKNALKNPRTLAFSEDNIKEKLDNYFPEKKQNTDWQKVAVATAIKSPFSIITGGPGTGKTTTVTRLLLVLQELHDCKLHIKLVAPTGKAASRLEESIHHALNVLNQNGKLTTELLNAIPQKASTLHSLLGANAFKDHTRYHSRNPLQVDVLVVDETSMIDLPMMAKLVNALKPETRLILLGDQAQLASVEAGAVLGELAKGVDEPYSQAQAEYLMATTGYVVPTSTDHARPMRDCLCHLTESRRFKEDSGIGKLSETIQKGKANESLALFSDYPQELHFNKFATQDETNCVRQVVKSAVENYRTYLTELQFLRAKGIDLNAQNEQGITYAEAIQEKFNQIRFLTALRNHALGVENLNQEIARALYDEKLIYFRNEKDWYIGKPIMITENDHNVRLYNGDIGLCLGDGKVWFGNREVLTSRIPKHEPAFIMTIHKSQGSEFEHTVMVLPTEPNPVLSRELVFTGVTRAKNELTIFSTAPIWKNAVREQAKRQSGLGEWLEGFYWNRRE